MNILFIGDVYGNHGLKTLEANLETICEQYNVDFVIANGENASSGKGLRKNDYQRLKKLKVDVITLGNHAFWQQELLEYINQVDDIIRPLNWDGKVPGFGSKVFNFNNIKIRVTNILGKVFMNDLANNAFIAFENLLKTIETEKSIHIIDFHAEATSEKIAFAFFVDGKVNAVIGTHTHVPTADYRLLPNGTAYITDVGMVGPYNSAIGVKVEDIIYRFYNQLPIKFTSSNEGYQIGSVLLEIDETTLKTKAIKQIYIKSN